MIALGSSTHELHAKVSDVVRLKATGGGAGSRITPMGAALTVRLRDVGVGNGLLRRKGNRMNEADFWSSLEYRLCREFAGLADVYIQTFFCFSEV